MPRIQKDPTTTKHISKKGKSKRDLAFRSLDWEAICERVQTTTPTEPGIYPNLDFETYTRIDALNASFINTCIIHSPRKARFSALPEDAPYFRLGHLVHDKHEAKRGLDENAIANKYVVVPEAQLVRQVGNDPKTNQRYKSPKATRHYKALKEHFLEKHPGKIAVSDEWMKIADSALRDLNRNMTKEMQGGIPELTLVWKYKYNLYKARLDWLFPSGIIDLKTTKFPLQYFDLAKFGYHRQAGHYFRGYRYAYNQSNRQTQFLFPRPDSIKKFWFAVLDVTMTPSTCIFAPISDQALQTAYAELDIAYALIHRCKEQRRWPGVPSPTQFNLPPHYKEFTHDPYVS